MRSFRVLSAAILSVSLLAGAAFAQDRPPAAVGQITAPKEPLLDGLGRLHHEVGTRSPLAQRYFDQGLRLVYAFNHDEARRSFEEAARQDPDLAMAYWGIALALGPNINARIDPAHEEAAYEAIQEAIARMDRARPEEQAYIRALATRYAATPGAGRRDRDVAYADAMRALTHAYPDDLDAATLFAESLLDLHPWALWTPEGAPEPGTMEILATLESVLARDPDHPGANHYYIHAVEASAHPERALPSADRIGDLMPGAGHMVHMASHIYMRLGRYAEAADANVHAVAADRAYLAAVRPEGDYALTYYPHNLQFLAAAAAMAGRRAESVRAARDLDEAIPDRALAAMPMMETSLATLDQVLLRFGAWDEVLAEPAPPEAQRFTTAIHHFARGVALAHEGRLDEAAEEAARFDWARARVPQDLQLSERNRAPAVLAIAAAALEGQIAAARGDLDGAVAALTRAAALEDALGYAEPPDWLLPARHVLGAVLLEAGRPDEAERVYREDLKRNPENGWALFGLAQSLRRQGQVTEAEGAERRFARAFATADVAPCSSGW